MRRYPPTAQDGAVDWMGIAAQTIERMLEGCDQPRQTARSVSAMYDPITGAVTLDITRANGEPDTIELPDPQGFLETLSNALSERAKDACCIAETGDRPRQVEQVGQPNRLTL